MSHKTPEFLIGVKAGEDHTGNLHKAYKLDADGNLVLAGLGEGIGTLYNETDINGPIEGTTIGGGSDAVAAVTVAPGNEISSDANGDAKLAVTGELVFGICMENATVGQHFSYLNTIYRKV